LLDAYVEFAGAATELHHIAIDVAFDEMKSDVASLRFDTARGRLRLQENDPHCRKEIEDVSKALDDLFSVRVFDDETDEDTAAAIKAADTLEKMNVVKGRIDLLTDSARLRLGSWWKFWA
jgi:hypothetical protein